MRRLLAIGFLLCAAAGGCGFGAGEERDGGAELRVTKDFGHEELSAEKVDQIREDQTIMRLLQSEHEVDTRFGGNFVQTIDGLSGDESEQRDWFFFVNGIEADKGAADWELSSGDVVQWDNRDWGATQRIPAIVGAFPEPFVSGLEGDRLPVRLECAEGGDQACRDVKATLTAEGAQVNSAQLGASGGSELIRVLVGRWEELRDVRSATIVEEGPESSGVFARFSDGGERLELLDADGNVAEVAELGTGLVAATAIEDLAIVWLVTGTDDVGVEAAAASLDELTLRNAFAVAATPSGPLKLPVAE